MIVPQENQFDRAHARVNELDLLRFFAALAVVFHHYSLDGFAAESMTIMPYPLLASISKYGYLGVELFFMISGFVILMTASNGDLKKFVISRLIRLYPAFWVCCSITFFFTLAIGASDYSASINQYLINMTLLSGFMDVPPIDGVYWSLFVELKFYAFVAVILVLGRIQQAELFIILWLAVTIALVFHPIQQLRFLMLKDYSTYFIAGATFFLIWAKGLTWTRCTVIAVSWCLAIYQSTKEIHEFEIRIRNDLDPYIITAIICAYFVIMTLISLKRMGAIGKVNWVWLGALTYPLYLIHQNLGFMIYNAVYTQFNPQVLFWLLVFGMIMLAYLIHIAIEKPLAKSMKNFFNKLTENLKT